MEVALAYGRNGLEVSVPDDAVVVDPLRRPGLADQEGAVVAALRAPAAGPPLAELIEPGRRVAVVFPDVTRPMPNRTVLPPLLAELETAGADPADTVLLCATGTHRPATRDELVELLGADIVARYAVENHVATSSDHVRVGDVDGAPILLERRYVEADLRIVTGFVEPHFFAGFSGGPKAVCPGLAALETVLEAHSPARIADPRATWAVLEGNPVHEFVRAAAALDPPEFAVDVAINDTHELTAVFAGTPEASHRAACAFVRETAMERVDGLFDVVVSTNGGYPLDRNLYQAVKGMAAAELVVRPGGTIVMAAACADGVPAEGRFGSLLAEAASPRDLMRTDRPSALDRWQVQVLGRVLGRARVDLYSDGLEEAEVRSAFLEPVASPTAAVEAALRAAPSAARVCVLPHGPLTIAAPA
jgi:nickel-dependent lactate racemase